MIIASKEGITLEINGNIIVMHNNQDGVSIMDYMELTIDLSKEEINKFIEELKNDYM